ncbi:hypothetical protein E4K72_02170 [Oxalobacteraceae bacterium OM1]|nr:hypothetical protein E4K72_02170 [Oxalobacteraceae bacterium OM1]
MVETMIERNHLGLCLGAIAVCMAAWLFVGFERYVGDHETGMFWEPFLKRRPSLQMTFRNPAQSDLEILPPDSLGADTKAEFLEYCRVRFGLDDMAICFETIKAARI